MPGAPDHQPILSLRDCTLVRGERELLTGLSLNVHSGECIWVTGANGIGKSSLLRLCAGLLRPQSGTIAWTYEGLPSEPTQCVSYQPHLDAVWPLLSAREVLAFWGKLARRAEHVSAAIEKLSLSDLAAQSCRTLSAGQSRRVAMAKLLIEDRPLWLMDEPTAPLDAGNRELVRTIMADHLNAGGSIIIASHTAPVKFGASDKVLALKEAETA